MRTPHRSLKRGLKMSIKGGQNLQKDGGPHTGPHESYVFIVDNDFSTDLDVQTYEPPRDKCIDERNHIQDGGHVSDIEKSTHGGERLCLLAMDPENIDSTDNVDTIRDFTDKIFVDDDNTEWIKTRCRNLDAIDIDINNAKLNSKDITEFFESDLSGNSVSSPGSPASGNVSENRVPMSADSPGSGNGSMSVLMAQAEGEHEGELMSIKTTKINKESLNPQDQACLEELERGSQLNQEEKELLENSRKELQALEFQALMHDRSNMLMTAQELESMPDDGLEFEESVGPKESSQLDSLTVQNQNDFDSFMANVFNSGLPSVEGISNTNRNGTNSNENTDVSAGTSNSDSDQTQPTLATIAISTDQSSNSTQITINTGQGQRVYRINTANLAQATSAIGAMGNADLDAASGKADTSGLRIQDGYLVIPVQEDQEDDDLDGENLDAEDLLAMSSERVYPCTHPGCNKLFSKPSKLKIHYMCHTGERPFRCTVDGCDWAFTTAYKLKRHEESHKGRKDFVCSVEGCGRKFTTIYNLNSHVRLHQRPCSEMCPEPGCGARFATKRKLDLHMKNHAGAEKTYKCPVEGCNKTFISSTCMGSHARVHQQERDLTCRFEGCNKKFDRQCRLKQHMRSHTGEKPYVCSAEGCGWAFATASKLKRHERKHTGERRWVCPHEGCGKAFMRAEHLKGHMITHSGDRPFRCPVEGCPARFTAKSTMYVHIKKHNQGDDKIIYHCPLDGCTKKYTTKTSLRHHITKHYQDLGLLQHVILPAEENVDALNLDALSQAQAIASSAVPITVPGAVLSQDTVINPADLISTGSDQQSIITAASLSDVIGQQVQVTPNMMIVSNELLQMKNDDLVATATAAAAAASCHDAPKITIASSGDDSAEVVLTDQGSGSARTDYHSNHYLSDRAKKRRKLSKDSGSLEGYQDLGLCLNKSSEGMVISSTASLMSTPSTSSVAHSNTSQSLVSSGMMSSHGITIKDPETGAIYVQTQLLQDDPPNPELYGDEVGSVVNADQAGLVANLPILLQGQDTDTADHRSTDTAEFTGTTINLQDLE